MSPTLLKKNREQIDLPSKTSPQDEDEMVDDIPTPKFDTVAEMKETDDVDCSSGDETSISWNSLKVDQIIRGKVHRIVTNGIWISVSKSQQGTDGPGNRLFICVVLRSTLIGVM